MGWSFSPLTVFTLLAFISRNYMHTVNSVLVVREISTESNKKLWQSNGTLMIFSNYFVRYPFYRTDWLSNFAYIMLVAGGVFVIIAGAGLCGACCKSECLLIVVSLRFLLLRGRPLELQGGGLEFFGKK